MANFPTSYTPSWLTQMAPSSKTVVRQDFEAGGNSRLRMSDLEVGGQFTAVFNQLDCNRPLITLMDFWRNVEDFETVQFTLSFFSKFPLDVRDEIISWSPLGNWLMERPKLELVSNRYASAVVTFESVIN